MLKFRRMMPRGASEAMRRACHPERRFMYRVARARLRQPEAARHGLRSKGDRPRNALARRGAALREAAAGICDWHGTAGPALRGMAEHNAATQHI